MAPPGRLRLRAPPRAFFTPAAPAEGTFDCAVVGSELVDFEVRHPELPVREPGSALVVSLAEETSLHATPGGPVLATLRPTLRVLLVDRRHPWHRVVTSEFDGSARLVGWVRSQSLRRGTGWGMGGLRGAPQRPEPARARCARPFPLVVERDGVRVVAGKVRAGATLLSYPNAAGYELEGLRPAESAVFVYTAEARSSCQA